MTTHVFPVTCCVCGGEGTGTAQTAISEWKGAFIHHKDPRVCAKNIRKREAEREKKKKENVQG